MSRLNEYRRLRSAVEVVRIALRDPHYEIEGSDNTNFDELKTILKNFHTDLSEVIVETELEERKEHE